MHMSVGRAFLAPGVCVVRRCFRSSGIRVKDNCKLSCGRWELNPGSL